MAQVEHAAQSPETRIILVGEDNHPLEVKPKAAAGTDLLNGVRTTLLAAINDELLEVSPFIVVQPEESAETAKAPAQSVRQHTLEIVTAAYVNKPDSHELLSELYQAHWDYHGIELMGLSPRDTRVSSAPYKDEEIRGFMKLDNPQPGNPGADLGYFHLPVLASADENTRVLIGKGFPYMGSWVFDRGYNIKNGHQISGWMRVDAGLDAPFRINQNGELTGLTEDELKKAIEDAKRVGETINIYGPSGDVIKKVFKYFPDQGATLSRLPESSGDGGLLRADFRAGGHLYVSSYLRRGRRLPHIGGRSFLGANKA